MKFSFLGYSVEKIMEFKLDVKDVAILRYFDDFRKSGKMKYELIDGVKYYWISYRSVENELPFLGLGKKAIMLRMLKLRDLGILSHYTKKEGGTFSFYALGERYKELLYDNERSNDYDNNTNNNISYGKSNPYATSEEVIEHNISCGQTDELNINEEVVEDNILKNIDTKDINKNEEGVIINIQGVDNLENCDVVNLKNGEGLSLNKNRGCAWKCSTKTNLLNNLTTILTNIKNNIKDNIFSIIDYLKLKVSVIYRIRTSNTKTINLIKVRLSYSFICRDFCKINVQRFINSG